MENTSAPLPNKPVFGQSLAAAPAAKPAVRPPPPAPVSWYERKKKDGMLGSTLHATPYGSPHLRCLFYGATGSGKTLAALSFPKALLINFDKGELTASSRQIDIPMVSFHYSDPVYDDMRNLIMDARDKTGPFAEGGEYADIKTLIIDSATDLADMLYFEAMGIDGIKTEKRGMVIVDPADEKAEFDHYNKVLWRMLGIAKMLKDANRFYHIVVTAGEVLDKDFKTQMVIGGVPDIIGSYRRKMAFDFDEVYHFLPKPDPKKGGSLSYYAHTRPHEAYWIGKSRFDIPPLLENVTFASILSEWEKSHPGSTSAIVDKE